MLRLPQMPNLLTSQPHANNNPFQQTKQSHQQPASAKSQPPSAKSTEEEARVYFGNVPYQITENEIKTFFEKCGEVKAVHMVRDKNTKRFQGYGFITFGSKQAQTTALLLNAQMFRDRKLKVNLETKAMPTKTGKRIYIKNINMNTPDEEVKNQFEQFGKIEGFFTIKDKNTKQSRGFGFMDFSTADEAKAALSMDGKTAFGKTLTVLKAHSSRQDNMTSSRGGFARGQGNFARGAGGWCGRGGFARAYAPYEQAPWEMPNGGWERGGFSGRGGRRYHVGDANYAPKTGFGYGSGNPYGAGSQQQGGCWENQQQGEWQNQQQGPYQNQQPSPYKQF